jgi:2-dehydro-3-deoxyphosphogluconate aldolase / (4S)-4-hydroxy-2-oxoglutarate aldolase
MSATAGAQRARTARAIESLGAVAVIRAKDSGKLRAIVHALTEGGVKAIEVTMTVPNAVGLIRELAPALPEGCILGAGTVIDGETARAVIDAGASFVVGPVLRPELIRVCHERDIAVVPGCFSPTEILSAHEAGADIVKVFPATSLGPQFIKDVRAPLPALKLMPTGGVSLENAGEWIRAGAVAVGVGSALVEARAVDENRFDLITSNARRLAAAVLAARAR